MLFNVARGDRPPFPHMMKPPSIVGMMLPRMSCNTLVPYRLGDQRPEGEDRANQFCAAVFHDPRPISRRRSRAFTPSTRWYDLKAMGRVGYGAHPPSQQSRHSIPLAVPDVLYPLTELWLSNAEPFGSTRRANNRQLPLRPDSPLA